MFQGVTLHVSASKIKLLEVAEELELRKRDSAGLIREFLVSQLEDFLVDGMHVDDLLTTADRQTIVRYELENIRALPTDTHVPGCPQLRLYEGQSIGTSISYSSRPVKTQVNRRIYEHFSTCSLVRRTMSSIPSCSPKAILPTLLKS